MVPPHGRDEIVNLSHRLGNDRVAPLDALLDAMQGLIEGGFGTADGLIQAIDCLQQGGTGHEGSIARVRLLAQAR